MSRYSVLLVATMTVLILSIAGQARSQEEPKEKKTVPRVYDIRDLLMQRRAYPAESALVPPTRIGKPGDVIDSLPQATTSPSEKPQTPADILVSLIQDTIDPDSWRENGGNLGAIRQFEGQLIVTQTADNHDQLNILLQELRETSARMVTIRAHWVSLNASTLKTVAKPLAEDAALFAVDLAAVEKLAADDPTMIHFQGQVTCFNTQTVNVSSGDARTVVWGQTSNTGGGDNAVGYDAQSSIVQAGMLLEVTPVLTPDATTVMLDVQSVASDWGAKEGNPAPPATRPTDKLVPPEVDRVKMNVQQLRTSVALPIGKPVIVGGMTFAPWSEDQDKQLYLVIEASSSAPRNGAADAGPPAKP